MPRADLVALVNVLAASRCFRACHRRHLGRRRYRRFPLTVEICNQSLERYRRENISVVSDALRGNRLKFSA